MEYTKADLKQHLAEEHRQSPFSEYLKEIVYGGNDGIVTTFAVVAGFAGAQASVQIGGLGYLTVLLFGLANLFADGSSMALGNFLAVRSDQNQYRQERAKEEHEIRHEPLMEQAETKRILLNNGFSDTQADDLVAIYSTNKEYWVDFMMRYELEMPNPEGENPLLTSIATFFAFVTFGSIPLLPYILAPTNQEAFSYAVCATALALFLLGILRWRVTTENFFRSTGETLFIGGISAMVAYMVGIFFRM